MGELGNAVGSRLRRLQLIASVSWLELRRLYHLRCVGEDATDPEMTNVEPLALVRDRARRIREIRRELEAAKVGGLEADRG